MSPAGSTPGSPREAFERYPGLHARTRGFTLGQPRSLRVSPDGARVAFLRSAGGEDPVNRLWVLDLPEARERCVADPVALAGDVDEGELPDEERARRERAREAAGGIVGYGTDRALELAAFALAGRLFTADLAGSGAVAEVAVDGPVVDPRPDPTGAAIAYAGDGALWVVPAGGGAPRRLADDGDPDVTWATAEFVAAEEMGRGRGYWWAPDGQRLAVARVDNREVDRWHVTDPAEPSRGPTVLAYPAAGQANATVGLAVVDLDGRHVEVGWDRAAFPYLARVSWDSGGLVLAVQSRDQRHLHVLDVDPASGSTTLAHAEHDPNWVELVPGLPRRLPGGGLLHAADSDDTRRLAVDGVPVTPSGLQVRRVVAVDGATVLVTASQDDPSAVALWRVPLGEGRPEPLGPSDGVHDAAAGGGVVALTSRSLERVAATTLVRHPGGQTVIASRARSAPLSPRPRLLRLGERGLRAALLLPSGHRDGDGPLPVLCDPYGGPHAQRVLQAGGAFLTSQWFAEAGFAVLVADGRGSPGRGPAWERALAGDLASAPLEDQVEALHAAAERHPGVLDLTRVGIRGWSFGGFLAACAVLRRPDVFHAAVAGAPVTDWRLYDTHYTERYLGLPQERPEAYRRSSLLDDAASLSRPLLLIHGLADDNVVAAHSLRLSAALLASGRPHRFQPLVGVTHMARQEAVAENLLWLQLRFLRESLAVDGPTPPA